MRAQRDLVDAPRRRRRGRRRSPRAGRGGTRRHGLGPARAGRRLHGARTGGSDTAPAAVLQRARHEERRASCLRRRGGRVDDVAQPADARGDDARRRRVGLETAGVADRLGGRVGASATTRDCPLLVERQVAAAPRRTTRRRCRTVLPPTRRAARHRQLSAAVPPRGDAQPGPVTTTRRSGWWRRGGAALLVFAFAGVQRPGVHRVPPLL